MIPQLASEFNTSVRLWLMNRFSVQIEYGLEFDIDDGDFDEDALTILPSFHF